MRICIIHSLNRLLKMEKYVILKNMTKKGAKEYAVDTF